MDTIEFQIFAQMFHVQHLILFRLSQRLALFVFVPEYFFKYIIFIPVCLFNIIYYFYLECMQNIAMSGNLMFGTYN